MARARGGSPAMSSRNCVSPRTNVERKNGPPVFAKTQDRDFSSSRSASVSRSSRRPCKYRASMPGGSNLSASTLAPSGKATSSVSRKYACSGERTVRPHPSLRYAHPSISARSHALDGNGVSSGAQMDTSLRESGEPNLEAQCSGNSQNLSKRGILSGRSNRHAARTLCWAVMFAPCSSGATARRSPKLRHPAPDASRPV